MRRSDSETFDEFVSVHGDSLIKLSYALCGNREQAQDATQESLTRLYQRWRRIADPLPYARRCVINATHDYWRRSSRRERREQSAALREPDGLVRFDDLVADRDRLVRALWSLPYGQRAVIVLRYWHQLSEPEIASVLGTSIGTVKSQASRGIHRLRGDLLSDLMPANPQEQQ